MTRPLRTCCAIWPRRGRAPAHPAAALRPLSGNSQDASPGILGTGLAQQIGAASARALQGVGQAPAQMLNPQPFQVPGQPQNPLAAALAAQAGMPRRGFVWGCGFRNRAPGPTPEAAARLSTCDFGEFGGAARGIRTPDPLITNEVLYQLSYCGNGWRCNSRRGAWQAILDIVHSSPFAAAAIRSDRSAGRSPPLQSLRSFSVSGFS